MCAEVTLSVAAVLGSRMTRGQAGKKNCLIYVDNLPSGIPIKDTEDVITNMGTICDMDLKNPMDHTWPLLSLSSHNEEVTVYGLHSCDYDRCLRQVESPTNGLGTGQGGSGTPQGSHGSPTQAV